MCVCIFFPLHPFIRSLRPDGIHVFCFVVFFCPVSESKPSAPFISIPPPQLAASPLKRVTPLPPDVKRGDSGGRVVLGAGSHHLDKKTPPHPPVLGGVANLADGDVPPIPREAGGGGFCPPASLRVYGKLGVFFVPSSCIFQGVK